MFRGYLPLRKLIFLALILISIGLVFGCVAGDNQVENDDQAITVVTTIYPFPYLRTDRRAGQTGQRSSAFYLLRCRP